MRRYTTFVGTDPQLRRAASAVVSAALIAELAAAVVLLGHLVSARTADTTPWVASTAQLPQNAAGERTTRLVGKGPNALALLTRISAEMDGAVEAVVEFWGSEWSREIVVVAAATDEEFGAQAGDPNRDWSGIAAVAVADGLNVERVGILGQRIVFAPGAAAMSDAALRIVLRHELFHFAARAETAVDAPRWLTEGVADYVARPPTPRPGPHGVRAVLPTDEDLDATGPRRSAAYDQAWWFARFVADEYGASALRQLYQRACGPGYAPLPIAVAETLRSELTGLLDEWGRWLAGR